MNRRIAQYRVLADHRGPRSGHYDDALSVAGDDVLIDDVAGRGADDADAEIVRRIGETVATGVIQPDPAVMSGDSNTAAGGGRRSVANGRDAFNQRSERVGGNEDAGTAVRGRRKSLNPGIP